MMQAMDEIEGKWQRIADIVGRDQAPTMSELAAYDLQRDLAKTGQAVNQCVGCGNYSIDSSPPVLHTRDCSTRQADTPEARLDFDLL